MKIAYISHMGNFSADQHSHMSSNCIWKQFWDSTTGSNPIQPFLYCRSLSSSAETSLSVKDRYLKHGCARSRSTNMSGVIMCQISVLHGCKCDFTTAASLSDIWQTGVKSNWCICLWHCQTSGWEDASISIRPWATTIWFHSAHIYV